MLKFKCKKLSDGCFPHNTEWHYLIWRIRAPESNENLTKHFISACIFNHRKQSEFLSLFYLDHLRDWEEENVDTVTIVASHSRRLIQDSHSQVSDPLCLFCVPEHCLSLCRLAYGRRRAEGWRMGLDPDFEGLVLSLRNFYTFTRLFASRPWPQQVCGVVILAFQHQKTRRPHTTLVWCQYCIPSFPMITSDPTLLV